MTIAKPHLLIIDPQFDFCNPAGSLFVKGAVEDCNRTADFINRVSNKLADIHVTLDCHHLFDIAHPIYWKGTDGKHPNPFTMISVKDVQAGTWLPSVPSLFKRSMEYVKALEAGGRYPLLIWPPHCLIGTNGNTVDKTIQDALLAWESTPGNTVNYVTKGSNVFTEHYSVFRAEVADPQDPSTSINRDLVSILQNDCDDLIVCGQALSHCVANSVRDLVKEFGDDSIVKKIVLLTDCTSSVGGFETMGTDFIAELTAKGMRTALAADYLK
jgi:nicotinamidase-related amidase